MSAGGEHRPVTQAGGRPFPRRLAILGSRGIPARYGGFETFAEELSTRLARAGVEVTVFCQGRPEAGREFHEGVRLAHVRAPGGPWGALYYDLRALWQARRGFDVVYMLGYGAGLFLWIPRLAGRTVWVNMDGREWRRAKWGAAARAWLRWMEGCALRAAHRVVCDSAAVATELVRERAPRAPVSVLEYGAALSAPAEDPPVLEALSLRPAAYYLLVARIEPENHVLESVRAFVHSDTQRELVVVGDLERGGRYVEACRAAARVDCAGRVRFLGAVFDRAVLRTLRAQAWAVIHGHSVGGTNPSLLEALAAGAPVLAHDNPYNREVLGEHAFWFRDEPGLGAALAACERLSPAGRAALGQRGRARIAERYTWERIAGEYAALLGLGARGAEPGVALERPAPVEPPALRPERRREARGDLVEREPRR
jgi:glycosyltransferase involved in cell wall biosynthesis